MHYRSPNAISDQDRVYYNIIVIRLDSGHRLDTIGIRTFARCDFRHLLALLSMVTKLLGSDRFKAISSHTISSRIVGSFEHK